MSFSRCVWIGVLLAGLVVLAWVTNLFRSTLAHGPDPRLVAAEQRAFVQVIRCQGSLQPVNRQPITPKVSGTVLKLAEDGSTVKEGDVILQLDPQPYQDKLDGHKDRLRRISAEWDRDEKRALKEIRQAEDVVASGKLRLALERLRLEELESGPTEKDELNQRVTLENARNLLEARMEEYKIFEELATDGFISVAEARQKKLEVQEQEAKVAQADVAYRKLHRGDPVKLGEQRLKVKESEKAVASSEEKVQMLKGDLERASAKHKDEVNEEMRELKEHGLEIEQTRCVAAVPGIVLHGRGRYGRQIAPGIPVHSGSQAMILCDMRKMKALVAIDEGRIGRVEVGQPARIRVLGRTEKTYPAKVTKTAEKGHDEFESYDGATRDLTGKANRQVFDVEVELDVASPGDLRPDQRVEVEIEVRNVPDALVVPRTAIYRDAHQEAWVYVASNGEPERRTVEVLAEDQHACAVKGLKLGEKVWRVRP